MAQNTMRTIDNGVILAKALLVIRKFSRRFYFCNFVKIKSSRNAEITLLFTDICKSLLSREFLTSQICLLTLFAKILFSRKIPDLQYLELQILG